MIARRSLCPEKLGSNPGQGSKGINFSGWHGLDMNVTFLGIIFGLQSDAAFYYLRLDQYSLSVGMFCSMCGLTRRPLGRLATASSSAGNASRHVERGLVVNQS